MKNDYLNATQAFTTILDFLRFGLSRANEANLYYGHGTDNAWDDIVALISGSLALSNDWDPILLQACLTEEEKQALAHQLERRIVKRVPVPYLTQIAWFCDLSFYVDERVLIPRSPIAELIKQQFTPWIETNAVTRILDLCTGSGCIAIACCYAFPNALVDAVDISSQALAVAERNRREHGVEDMLSLINSDCFNGIQKIQYDIIVSNPPYVGSAEMQGLPQEYRHEPTLALEAENNGLAIVERILFDAYNYLSDHGILVVETGNSEQELVEKYPKASFTWLDFESGGQGVFLLTRQQLEQFCQIYATE